MGRHRARYCKWRRSSGETSPPDVAKSSSGLRMRDVGGAKPLPCPSPAGLLVKRLVRA